MPKTGLKIDPRKLIYFASIIEHGSFKRAAKALGLSQPALSLSMDRLEADLDIRLLARSPSGILPTALGDMLYCHARLIRSELVLAERELLDAIGGAANEIRLGSLPSLAGSIVPTALSKWREAHSEVGLHVSEAAQIDLLTGMLRREYDFVIGYTECYDIEDGLRQRVLFRDSLCVIARPGHPLAEMPQLSWEEIVRFPWISPTSRRPHSVLQAALQIAQVPPPVQSTFCGSVSLQKSLISSSDHLAMLPAHAVRAELQEGRLIALPIQDPTLHRNIAVFFREGYVPEEAGRALIDCVASVGLAACRQGANGPPSSEP
ncbi:LysR family transcriptional regulator [Paracoccus pantotrophus]|uniref:LysR family transcriptional regulator n=1 Tax=Paracoccus pantotrophus TaxID=82367 RepID=A0A7H9BP27_PARPN|nr:LysR family transcriptional regulator [Paracoccus pantotrophus]QLH13040.1 LysR family transcriptional regulator [Paracoccus pantotrophus]